MTVRSAVALRQALAVFASLLLATAALSGPAHAAVTVDCSKPGQTIGKKLASATKLLEIIVKGHCVENLEIDRDDVTITAGVRPRSRPPTGRSSCSTELTASSLTGSPPEGSPSAAARAG